MAAKSFNNKLIYLLFTVFFVAVHLSSFAQTKEEIDDLQNELYISLPDTNKVNILNKLSEKTHSLNYEQSLNYALEALDLAKFLNFKKGILYAYSNIAFTYHLLGKTVLAKEYLDKALSLANELNDKKQIVIIYNYYYLLYNKIESYDKACEYIYKALKLSEEIGYQAGIAAMSINIASCQSDKKKKIEYMYRALEISKKLNHKKKIALINNNLGVLALNEQKYDEALAYFYKATETYERLESYNDLVLLYKNIGLTLSKKGNMEESLENNRKSYYYANKLKDSLLIGMATNQLASYFFDVGNMDSAYYYIHKAYKIDTSINNVLNIMGDAYLLYQLNYVDKKYVKAIDFLEIYDQMKDSLIEKKRRVRINNLEAKYSLHKLEKKIQLMEMKNRLFRLKSISVLIFIILVSIIVVQRLNKKRIKNIKDKEIYALKLKRAETEIKRKEAELKSFTMTIVEKNKQIRRLQSEIVTDEKYKNKNLNLINQKREKLRNLRILTEDDWLRFKHIFTEVHPTFLDNINQMNPDLSEGDKRQLMLIKLGFSISQSAEILGVGYKAIQKARQRLAKKLNIDSSRDLLALVRRIEAIYS